jgi:hypothetical protein
MTVILWGKESKIFQLPDIFTGIVKIFLFLATLSATVPCCRICTKSTSSMSSHQAEKNHHVDKQIEILQLIALGTTGLMMARGLVKQPIHKMYIC